MTRIIFDIANTLLTIIMLAIIIRAFLSWVYPVGRDPWTKILLDLTEPILAPIRSVMMRILPIPIDLSPLVVILLIQLLQSMLARAYFGRGF
ncbi:MAG: YggT family protein [Chloroflexota bacterium]|nr:YggT family protein [Chloroflexota bacterium]MDQ5864800.1 YggT family protein [Chloroflexota bacterium]